MNLNLINFDHLLKTPNRYNKLKHTNYKRKINAKSSHLEAKYQSKPAEYNNITVKEFSFDDEETFQEKKDNKPNKINEILSNIKIDSLY